MARPNDKWNVRVRSYEKRLKDMRARRPRREHRGRMRAFGVNKKRYLLLIPVLLILIAAIAIARDPGKETVRFRPSALSRVNPLMGWAVDADIVPGEVELDHSLVYARLSWRDFEPEKGVYDFESFEEKNHLNDWWAEGKRLILRFVMDVPSEEEHLDIPDWLYEELGERPGSYYDNARGRGFSPNYMNRLLIERHAMAIQALGARYDGHPGVAFVELGSLGHDGGWTVDEVDGMWAMPPSGDLRTWVWAYQSAFGQTPLMASAPYQPVRLTGIGLYNDHLGDEAATWDWLDVLEYGGFDENSGAELRGMGDFYRSTPVGAHLDRTVDQRALFGEGAGALVRELRATHATYVSGVQATDIDESMRAGQSVALLTMGYRLWVREASWLRSVRRGYRLNVDLTVKNDGAQAFSQAWPIELSLLMDGKVAYAQVVPLNVRAFESGTTPVSAQIELPADLSPGTYQLAVAVLDPDSGEPAVEFAMNAERIGLRSILGDIEIRRS